MAAAPLHVVLLGDSTIDNVVWVSREGARGAAVVDHLRAALPAGAAVTNLAADGFKTADVLHGGNASISAAARRERGDPIPSSGEDRASGPDFFAPLKALARAHAARPVTDVVLSIGGNDVREILGNLARLAEVTAAFQGNYAQIVAAVRAACPAAKLHLQLQYCPAYGLERENYGVYKAMDTIPGPGSSLGKLFHLMGSVYPPVLALARAHCLPVLDLCNTFDFRNHALYECQIEPSDLGGRLIAELIAHAVAAESRAPAPQSSIYARPPGTAAVAAAANDGAAPWAVRDHASS